MDKIDTLLPVRHARCHLSNQSKYEPYRVRGNPFVVAHAKHANLLPQMGKAQQQPTLDRTEGQSFQNSNDLLLLLNESHHTI